MDLEDLFSEELELKGMNTDDIVEEMIKKRRIIINSTIDSDLFEDVCLRIMKWNIDDKDIIKEKRKPIYIYINSDGGDMIFTLQLINSILTSITPIITVGFSKCASAACYLLAAGHKRYCFEHTVILYHDGSTGYMSSGNKGKDIQKFIDRLDELEVDFMLKHTNMTADFLEEIKDREYYMFAKEAREHGIIDKIIGVDASIEEIF